MEGKAAYRGHQVVRLGTHQKTRLVVGDQAYQVALGIRRVLQMAVPCLEPREVALGCDS